MNKFLRWLISSVIVTTLPLIASYLVNLLKNQPQPMMQLFGKGEVFLAVVSISAPALFIKANAQKENLALICKAWCFIIAFFATFLYVYVANMPSQDVNSIVVLQLSILLYCASLPASYGCIFSEQL
jgi:hypothetical protein